MYQVFFPRLFPSYFHAQQLFICSISRLPSRTIRRSVIRKVVQNNDSLQVHRSRRANEGSAHQITKLAAQHTLWSSSSTHTGGSSSDQCIHSVFGHIQAHAAALSHNTTLNHHGVILRPCIHTHPHTAF